MAWYMVSVDAFMPSLSGYSAASQWEICSGLQWTSSLAWTAAASLRSSSLRGLGRLRLAAAISPAL